MCSIKLSLILSLLAVVGYAIASEDDDDQVLVTDQVYLDLDLEGEPAGRVVIGLFGSITPKTVENFVALANHEVSVPCIYIASGVNNALAC